MTAEDCNFVTQYTYIGNYCGRPVGAVYQSRTNFKGSFFAGTYSLTKAAEFTQGFYRVIQWQYNYAYNEIGNCGGSYIALYMYLDTRKSPPELESINFQCVISGMTRVDTRTETIDSPSNCQIITQGTSNQCLLRQFRRNAGAIDSFTCQEAANTQSFSLTFEMSPDIFNPGVDEKTSIANVGATTKTGSSTVIVNNVEFIA